MPECVPCPACPAPPAPAGAPCPCRTCCCGKPPKVNPCYKQPKIPDSYAPRRCYVKPTAPVEGCTTYKLSYLPTCDSKNLRGVARKPAPNLVPSCEPMEGCTVQKLSFLPNPVCVTQPIRPCHHDMWGQGPMQAITTQRHDYVPKPSVLRESCKPPPKFHSVEQPFESKSPESLQALLSKRLPPYAIDQISSKVLEKPLNSRALSSQDVGPFATLPQVNEERCECKEPSKKKILVSKEALATYATDKIPSKHFLVKAAFKSLETAQTGSKIEPVQMQFGNKCRSKSQDSSGVRSLLHYATAKGNSEVHPIKNSTFNDQISRGGAVVQMATQAVSQVNPVKNSFKRKSLPSNLAPLTNSGILAPFATDPARSDLAKNPCNVDCECHQKIS